MKVNVVTIGSTPHAEWGVKSDMIKTGKNTFLNFFLQSDDRKVLQKIKLGGGKKEFPSDSNFDADYPIASGTVEQDGISIQELELPFGSVYVNPKNLNPYLANFEQDANSRLIILLMGTDYRYLRSNINHELGEIISTFHTPTAVACVIKVYTAVVEQMKADKAEENVNKESSNSVNVLMVDTVCGNEFTHFRINLDEDDSENEYVAVTKSIIKKPDLVKRLSNIDKKMTDKKTVRRFVRFTDAIITTHLVIPSTMTQEEAEKIINMHSASNSLTDSATYSLYGVDVDEKGFIIDNENLSNVIDTMVENKVKALTLIGCRMNKDSFGRVKPLYIFSFDSTEDVTKPESIKPIKCVKSN